VEGVTTAAGADASGRLIFFIMAATQRFAPEPVGLGNKLVRDALSPRAQASFFNAVIFYVAPALREHQDDAQDSPELEAKAMVVDQSHHDFTSSRAEPVSCRESGVRETYHSCSPRYVFSQYSH